jgi:CubicO group peptidase (beta-lactamase class C family)
MSPRVRLSRLKLLALAACAFSALANPAAGQSAVPLDAGPGPRFRADGPDADARGRAEGYPICTRANWFMDKWCLVGALSGFDQLYPARIIVAPKASARLGRAPSEPGIGYTFAGQNLTLEQYLDRHPVTGFLIAKGDTILIERYQYGRNGSHRLASFSMAKTIVALLIGIAVKEGAIRSIDDLAEVYVPGLKGTEYGLTPIKALLQMSSGVLFRERYTDPVSDIWILVGLTLGQDPGGSLAAVKRFNTRLVPPSQRFSYASVETVVLGLVLAHATNQSVSDYTREKLWQPIGAEADASWVLDATGQEITFAYFNAVLRDWARLGLMLAHDGIWQGKSIVPREWLVASTTIASADMHLRLGTPWSGYGYQTWIVQDPRRMFALRGYFGQLVIVDPESKLVLVQTAARPGNDDFADQELLALWDAAVAMQ